jgi:hypothetical protein
MEIVGGLLFLAFIFWFDGRYRISQMEHHGHYELKSAVIPFLIGSLFAAMGIANDAIGVLIVTAIYYLWAIYCVIQAVIQKSKN